MQDVHYLYCHSCLDKETYAFILSQLPGQRDMCIYIVTAAWTEDIQNLKYQSVCEFQMITEAAEAGLLQKTDNQQHWMSGFQSGNA